MVAQYNEFIFKSVIFAKIFNLHKFPTIPITISKKIDYFVHVLSYKIHAYQFSAKSGE